MVLGLSIHLTINHGPPTFPWSSVEYGCCVNVGIGARKRQRWLSLFLSKYQPKRPMSWNAQTPSLVFFSPNPFSESIASPRQGVWHRAVGQTVLVSGESGAGKTETTKCPGESAKRDLAVCLKPSHWWPPFKQSKKGASSKKQRVSTPRNGRGFRTPVL